MNNWENCNCFFQLLGLDKTKLESSDQEEANEKIIKKWKQRMLILHPDKTSNPEANNYASLITLAKDTLCQVYSKKPLEHSDKYRLEQEHDCCIAQKTIKILHEQLGANEQPADGNENLQNTGNHNDQKKQIIEERQESDETISPIAVENNEYILYDIIYRRNQVKVKIFNKEYDTYTWKNIRDMIEEDRQLTSKFLTKLKHLKPRRYNNLLKHFEDRMLLVQLSRESN